MNIIETGLIESRQARDAGMTQVGGNDGSWHDAFMSALLALPVGFEGIGEDFREQLLATGLPHPHHPNAWGANINAAKRAGYLVETGEYRQMQAMRSHARGHCPVLRRVNI